MESLTLCDSSGECVSVVPESIIGPIRQEFLASLPEREDRHPLGCHNPRIPDGVAFDKIIVALVSGMGYERVADVSCSATTIRRRRDEWIAAEVAGLLVLAVFAAYDRMVGLELESLSADGCITKAPSGGECAGKSPVDRGKQRLKRSQITDGYGIPVVTVPAKANTRDHTLLPETLREFTTLTERLDQAHTNRSSAWTQATTTARSTPTWPSAASRRRSRNAVRKRRSRPTDDGCWNGRTPG